MFFVARAPGKGTVLSASLKGLVLALAEAWCVELKGYPLPKLYSTKVKYRPEPLSNKCEEWVDPYVVLQRGHGDCDDLVVWRLAEIFNDSGYSPNLHRKGIPAWPAIAREVGTGRYHVLIRHANGDLEDPCKILLKKNGE